MLRRFYNGGSLVRRGFKVLCIETSCDDTCVSVLDRFNRQQPLRVLCHYKETLDSLEDGGIVPIKAHTHHQIALGKLTQRAFRDALGTIDLVCVTRGPGMVGSLSAGISFAKGLSVALNKPLIGVHHMLGHLLIPRMESNGEGVKYPFLSLLVSGGHTMLVLSRSAIEHEVLCDTIDIAVGDSLDKCAREIGIRGNMLAKEMESFINEDMEQAKLSDSMKIGLPNPLRNKNDRVNMQAFSFCPFVTAVKKNLPKPLLQLNIQERREIAYKIQEGIFKHVISQLNLVLRLNSEKLSDVKQFVCSGGVSANQRLRTKLETELEHDFASFHYPNIELCTDNAVMIGWAGIELYEKHGLTTGLGATAIRKWPIDKMLDVPDWVVPDKT
ncbi:putative N(6)-L-threonylcarbamoyladenine synthase Ecym_5633 [Eremothecium cymbalariae DBVPG|uniref:N(6)-L-threonylcarbamoyladenine synthase n=1 Tax=Eremothecium cymbalariae (strain CBS 270.75 / DBVPG 7215 / KCTC 17166 / NRRL Y-17582) TaxID=931890 RepID=I6NE77_ERECY|nr:hypothetical protein Ecym_5633 [Eremothecium cymbalariae DBVPG\